MPTAAVIIGVFAVLALLNRRARERPASFEGRTLGYRIGVTPTGPNGTYTRKDRLRVAGVSGITAVICLAISFGGAYVASQPPAHGWLGTTASAVMFLSFLLGLIALAAAVVNLGAAPFTRTAPGKPDSNVP